MASFESIQLLVARAQRVSLESRALLENADQLLSERAVLLDERIRVMREILSSGRLMREGFRLPLAPATPPADAPITTIS